VISRRALGVHEFCVRGGALERSSGA